MSVNLNINGTIYPFPVTGENDWGDQLTAWATALNNGVLQKTGGAFTLLSELDFGATYGAKLAYLKSRTSNPASAGVIRLSTGDLISFRNFANSADVSLSTNASDQLTWNGVAIQGVISVTDTATIDLTLTGSAISADIKVLSIDNSMISGSAAIDATKIADGTVTSVEFQYINTLSSNAQDQLNLKAPLTSPSFTTPSLGVATATSINGTSIPSTKTLVVTTDKLSVLAATTSLELAGVISDETGSGSLVFANTPTLVTPVLGVATATSINSTSIPTSKTLVVTTDKLSALSATTSSELAGVISDETGSGSLVFGTNPTLTTASIASPSKLDMKKDTLANLQTYASTATDGQLCFATDTLTTYVVKSSGLAAVGSGGATNYISAPDAEAGIGAWATYKNATGAATPDGTTTGTANSTFAVSSNTSMRGTSNFLFTKNSGASRQGEGFYYPFTIDASDKGKILQCSFEYQISSGTYADDAIEFFIWDVTNSRLVSPAPSKLKNSGIIEKFAIEFQTSIDSISYRLFAHVGVTTDSANTLRFDNFNLGPQAKLYGSAITDWVSYTPTITGFGTASNINAHWHRVGSNLELSVRFQAGTSTGVEARVSLPSGLVSADSTKILTLQNAGVYSRSTSSSGHGGLVLIEPSVGYVTFGDFTTFGSNVVSSLAKALGTAVENNSSVVSFTATIPILGWSSSQVMSSDADTRVVMFSGNSTTGTAITANVTDIPYTSLKDSHAGWSGTAYVVKVPGDYIVSTSLTDSASGNISTDVYVNAALRISKLSFSVGGQYASQGSAILYDLKAGDSVTIRSNATVTLTTVVRYLSISRIAGPAQIAASESVSALYTGVPTGTIATAWTNIMTLPTKVKDSHNAYSGGVFTVPVSGCYDFSASTWILSTLLASSQTYLGITIDGAATPFYSSLSVNSAPNSNQSVALSINSVPLLAGQTVSLRIYTEGTTNSFLGTARNHRFSITKSGNY